MSSNLLFTYLRSNNYACVNYLHTNQTIAFQLFFCRRFVLALLLDQKKPLSALYQSSSVKFTQLNVMSLVTTCKSDSPRLLLFEHVSCYTFGMCRIAMNPKDLTCKFHMDSYEPSTLSFSTLPIFSAMEYNVALALSDISRL